MLLEVTGRCEVACADCDEARAAGRAAAAGDAELDALREVVPALRPLGIKALALTGGEPILHPRFAELVELVCREGYRLGVRSHGGRVAGYLEALAPFRDSLDPIWLTLRSHAPPGEPEADRRFARLVEAIDAYRAAGLAVTVDHPVEPRTLGSLVALGELLAGKAITLHLRASDALPVSGETGAALIPQIHALKRILNERISLEPSLGVNHTYGFCSNFAAMDTTLLRANGDVVFCRRCRDGEAGGVLGTVGTLGTLGTLGGGERIGAILARHPRRVGAIWSARLAVMASQPPAMSNNCSFCLATLTLAIRAGHAAPRRE